MRLTFFAKSVKIKAEALRTLLAMSSQTAFMRGREKMRPPLQSER